MQLYKFFINFLFNKQLNLLNKIILVLKNLKNFLYIFIKKNIIKKKQIKQIIKDQIKFKDKKKYKIKAIINKII